MKKSFIYLFACLCVFSVSATSVAQDLKPSQIRGKAQKRVKPVSVLHQRYFKKSLRPEIGVLGGFILDEAYIDTKTFGARASLFFNEFIGLDLQYVKGSHKQTDDYRALVDIQAVSYTHLTLPTIYSV